MEPIQSGKFDSSAFPSTSEIQTVARKRKGLFGLTAADWGKIVAALAILYLFVGLLYYGLLEAAKSVRQEEWLKLPGRFFGDFDRKDRPLVGMNNAPVLFKAKDLSLDTEIERFYNRPDGCKLEGDLLACDRDNKQAGKWRIFPWVLDKAAELGFCENGQTFTTLSGREGVVFGNGDKIVTGVCISSVPTNSIPKAPARL